MSKEEVTPGQMNGIVLLCADIVLSGFSGKKKEKLFLKKKENDNTLK